ncbi:MAG: ATP-NAD kinase family protein [Bacillota bacterium]|nr:ATP-NAD kinase family protein [Bacillota bacterium]
MEKVKKVGFVINPVAGIGGKVGLKGSDGREIQEEAMEKGILPEAHIKAERALRQLLPLQNNIEIITFKGAMGGDSAEALGFRAEFAGGEKKYGHTEPADTEALAETALRENADLILFAGGDGTARNIYRAVGNRVPVIGIPAGVKIHSAVYAVTPESAGQAAMQYLQGGTQKTREAEVMDLDEELYRQGVVAPRLYGYMVVPENRQKMQNVKMRSVSENVNLDCIATDVIKSMEEDVVYLIGAGTTTRNIMEILGQDYTLIGIDAVRNGQLIGKDLDEPGIWDIVSKYRCEIVLTVIGGQGHILGRGNQQISPRIVRKVGVSGIKIVATKEKLLSLPLHRLLVDTGDAELDEEFRGYVRVITGLDERTMCAVGTAD